MRLTEKREEEEHRQFQSVMRFRQTENGNREALCFSSKLKKTKQTKKNKEKPNKTKSRLCFIGNPYKELRF